MLFLGMFMVHSQAMTRMIGRPQDVVKIDHEETSVTEKAFEEKSINMVSLSFTREEIYWIYLLHNLLRLKQDLCYTTLCILNNKQISIYYLNVHCLLTWRTIFYLCLICGRRIFYFLSLITLLCISCEWCTFRRGGQLFLNVREINLATVLISEITPIHCVVLVVTNAVVTGVFSKKEAMFSVVQIMSAIADVE